ncbi:SIS domain-containing protein [Microbacterium hydrocarbonoxydans]|uniref:SIS domain-containing protein n=1 Tax=Microbacterium hydrocarbonoxydans TaxID=273678 RepID=UPI002041CCF8|nr:SIS domain-containing protein [Microbacterium hydrocarbonoxydans]MCM3781256.1 SIS domain-containing protein [Microbacterium hydrocarbonoxydans]
MNTSPFEQNIREQPEALRALAGEGPDERLAQLCDRSWERIVLTGMGSSHTVGLPTWRALTRHGRAAWNVDAGQLLDAPELITPDTLVIATSQSGASAEIVELLDRGTRAGALIGIAADETSPLAQAADLYLPLRSGEEATVSTKSYLNSLVVHHRIAASFGAIDGLAVEAQLTASPHAIEALVDLDLTGIAQSALAAQSPRLATIGWADSAATALFAALIGKESSKVPIEGFVGGEFRHGPYELAGPGFTGVFFGASREDVDGPLGRIVRDLLASGALVVLVGDLQIEGATTVDARADRSLSALLEQSVVAQRLAVAIARENGVVPGAFAYGSKITATL